MDNPRRIYLLFLKDELCPTSLQNKPTCLSPNLCGDTHFEIKMTEFCQRLTFISKTKLCFSDQCATLALMGQTVQKPNVFILVQNLHTEGSPEHLLYDLEQTA